MFTHIVVEKFSLLKMLMLSKRYAIFCHVSNCFALLIYKTLKYGHRHMVEWQAHDVGLPQPITIAAMLKKAHPMLEKAERPYRYTKIS